MSAPVFACAALFALACAGAGSLRANDDAPANLLNGELPRGTILENASCSETVYATRQAVRKHPNQAVSIMKAAINSRVAPGDHPAKPGAAHTRDDKDVVVPCECVTRIVQAAVQAAPNGKAHDLVETAMAMQPQCGDEVAGLLHKPGIDYKDGPAVADNGNNGRRNGTDPGTGFGDGLIGGDGGPGYGGFGGGFGTGFPGSPGFIGSAPGGTGTFIPIGTNPVTSVVNQ